MRRSFRDASGFTLVELMVSLALFGLIMVAALPNLQEANRTHRLNSAVSQIETGMRRARAAAVKTRSEVRVSIDAGNRTCTIDQDTNDDGNFETRLSRFVIDDDVVLSAISFGGDTAVTFDERGAPDNPGSMILRTPHGRGRQLIVAAGSGSVTIVKSDAGSMESQ